MADGEYLLDNRSAYAGRRFDALSRIFNPVTFSHMEALGIQPGWRCWEVGTGGPSVPRWLAERVGPSPAGHVLATDIDVSWIGDGLGPAVDVQQHDVAVDDPPGGGFDLVHARLVLVHTPAREVALRHMVSALRPGGWLLLEDFDVAWQPLACPDPYRPEHELANKVQRGFSALLGQRGVDLEYGRKLPRLLAEQGLEDVAADAYLPVALEAVSALEASNVMQVRDALIAQGHASAEEIQRYLAATDQGLRAATPPLISAWGRRPATKLTPLRYVTPACHCP
jgi:SAM-dependent methyltransferase